MKKDPGGDLEKNNASFLVEGEDYRREECGVMLLRGFKVEVDGISVDVPEGYITAFEPLPATAQELISPTGEHMRACIVLSLLYETGGLGGEFTRVECDDMFATMVDRHWAAQTVRALIRIVSGKYWRG